VKRTLAVDNYQQFIEKEQLCNYTPLELPHNCNCKISWNEYLFHAKLVSVQIMFNPPIEPFYNGQSDSPCRSTAWTTAKASHFYEFLQWCSIRPFL